MAKWSKAIGQSSGGLWDENRDQGLQNWTGGTWNTIKLIGMDSRFALIHEKAQEQKWLKNLKEKKKNQISALFLTQRPPDDWP